MPSSPSGALKRWDKGASMSKANEKAAPGATRKAASKTNGLNNTTPTARGASARKHLTRGQRGRFWGSVGEAIEAAARKGAP